MRHIVKMLQNVVIHISDRHSIRLTTNQQRQLPVAVAKAVLKENLATEDLRVSALGKAEFGQETEIGPFTMKELSTDKDGFVFCILDRQVNYKTHTQNKPATMSNFEAGERVSPNLGVWLSPDVFKACDKLKIAHRAPFGSRTFHYFSSARNNDWVDLGWFPEPKFRQIGDREFDEVLLS